jgi:chromosome segregation ATPase
MSEQPNPGGGERVVPYAAVQILLDVIAETEVEIRKSIATREQLVAAREAIEARHAEKQTQYTREYAERQDELAEITNRINSAKAEFAALASRLNG